MLILYIFEESIIGIGLWLVTQLFKVAAFAFKIFMILAQSDVLKEVDYSLLLTNFYVILGIAMLFVMAFALLRGIVNPDDQKQGTTIVKNIIINFVIACVMLGFLPTIFPFMFDVQDSILRYNVIGGFFGYGSTGSELTQTDNVNEVEASSYRLVNGVFTAFFNVSDSYCINNVSGKANSKAEELQECQILMKVDKLNEAGTYKGSSFYEYKNYVDQTGQFGVYSAFIEEAADDNISFNFLVLLIAGIALLYIGTSYCFDMGLRLIKLIFYQILAPIPIFLRIIPNSKFSGTFNQWLKVTLTCWLEVFVRIFIFSFCMWLCSAIMSTNFISETVYKYGRTTGLFTTAFILMAIVMFMKRSPKLLSEITGIDSGNMKLGIREKLAEGGGFVAGAAVGGLATTGLKNAVGAVRSTREAYKEAAKNGAGGWKKAEIIAKGVGSGLLSVGYGGGRAFVNGARAGVGKKTFKDTRAAINQASAEAINATEEGRSYIASHGGVIGAIKGKAHDAKTSIKDFMGIDNLADLKKKKSNYDQMMGYMGQLKTLAEGEATVKYYAGQLKAQAEAKVDRSKFYKNIAVKDPATGQFKTQRVFDDKAYAQAMSAQAQAYEAAENRYKLAISQAIAKNAYKGNYKEIIEKYNTFRKEHMDDPTVAGMQMLDDNTLLSQWNSLSYNGTIGGDALLSTLGDSDTKILWSNMKSTSGLFDWAFNDDQAKQASGNVATEIARREAEEKKKSS